jgi:hypothetical protein
MKCTVCHLSHKGKQPTCLICRNRQKNYERNKAMREFAQGIGNEVFNRVWGRT